MNIEQIRSTLTSEIRPIPSSIDGNELASVLIIIYGKISFPGGKWCEQDQDLQETAIRETREELCLEVSKEHVIGQLDDVITLNSRYKITPFIAILDVIPNLTANSEVESILHIPLTSFLNTMSEDILPEHRAIKEMYTFMFEKYNVWGASARMLKQINSLLSEKNLL